MAYGKAQNASYGAGSDTALNAFQEAVQVAASLADNTRQIDALDYEFGITFNAGLLEKSLIPAANMLHIGQANNDLLATVSGYQVLGMANYAMGDFESARDNLEKCLEYKDQGLTGINSYPSMAMDYLSYVMYAIGDSGQAQELCDAAIQSAREESIYSTASALSNSCFTQLILGNVDVVGEYAQELIEIASQNELTMYMNRGLIFKNLVLVLKNNSKQSLEFVIDAVQQLLDSREEIDTTCLLGMIAMSQIDLGEYQQAGVILQRALDIAAKNGEEFYLAELHRIQGLLHLAQDSDDSALAIKCFQTAINIADKQGAHGWKGKAEDSLSQMVSRQ